MKAAIDAYMDDRLLVGANWDVWVMKNEAVRAGTAQVLRAAPDEIAVTASVSAGLNALASALDFTGPRNKVVISDFEFPTNAQIWHAQEPRGARVVHVPRAADGYIPLEKFESRSTSRRSWWPITHVCFRNGAKLDIPGIVRLAPRQGAMVLLDCYQSVGSLAVDVKALDVDFAVGGMLKYLLGTAGIGFLYVRGLVRAIAGADQQRLVRAGEHHGHGHHRQPALAQRAPLRGRYAGGGELLRDRGGSEDAARGRHAGHREAQLCADAPLHEEAGGDRLAEHHAQRRIRAAAPPSPYRRATAPGCPRSS